MQTTVKTRFKYLLSSIILFCFLFLTTTLSFSQITFNGFYIGQPFWDVYYTMKKLVTISQIPTTLHINATGIYPSFDKDLRLFYIRILPDIIFNRQTFGYEYAQKFADDSMKALGKEYFNVYKTDESDKIINYVYERDTTLLAFRLFKFGATPISPVILEKRLPPAGSVVKGLQLGMHMDTAKQIIKDKLTTNYYSIIEKQFFSIANTFDSLYVTKLDFYDASLVACFGVEYVDQNFINNFIDSYKFEVNEISELQFFKQTGIIKFVSGETVPILNNKTFKYYEGDNYYLIFGLHDERNNFNGGVSIVYKDVVKFTFNKLPPNDNRPTFD